MHALGILGDFPVEVVLEILEHLDARDVLRCQRVCKTLKEYIDSSAAVQYIIQLGMHGYKDGYQNGKGTIISRREQFEQFIDRWKYLDWLESRIEIPGFSSHALAGGIFAASDKNSITFVELPSRLRQSPVRTWSHTDIDFQVADFIMDPGQDLLVLIELQQLDGVDYPEHDDESEYEDDDEEQHRYRPVLHLRTLSVDTEHPRAFSSFLLPNCRADRKCVQLSVIDDLLGCLCTGDTAEPSYFTVWNWCTGEVECAAELHRDISTFLFIDPKMVLLPSRNDECNAITVYEVDGHNLREVVSLELFSCVDGVKLLVFLTSEPPLSQKPSVPGPFWLPDTRIIKLQCFAVSTEPREGVLCNPYDFFVPMSAIQQHVRNEGEGGGSASRIPWIEWGPDNSRCILSKETELRYSVHGNRYAMRSERYLSIYDFSPNVGAWFDSNPLEERRHKPEVEFWERSQPHKALGYLTKLIHIDSVATCLPCSVTERGEFSLSKYDQSAMIDDEHILLVDQSMSDLEAELVILTM